MKLSSKTIKKLFWFGVVKKIVLLLFVFISGIANANPLTMVKLANIVNEPDNKWITLTLLQEAEKKLTPTCTQLGKYSQSGISIYEQPLWESNNTLSAGRWSIKYDVVVCNKVVKRSLLYTITPKGKLAVESLLPGTTLADPDLQKDIQTTFLQAAVQANPACDVPYITDTRVTQVPSGADKPWVEQWQANACGTFFTRTLQFLPNEEGTLVSVEQK